jgi:hypothetical protein
MSGKSGNGLDEQPIASDQRRSTIKQHTILRFICATSMSINTITLASGVPTRDRVEALDPRARSVPDRALFARSWQQMHGGVVAATHEKINTTLDDLAVPSRHRRGSKIHPRGRRGVPRPSSRRH